MTINKLAVASASLGAILLSHPASAQVTITPDSPTWGEAITVTVDPSASSDEAQRFQQNDRLYAVLYTNHHGLFRLRDRVWTPMRWDGRRFTATLQVSQPCDVAFIYLATPERSFETGRRSLMCRQPDGSLPPGGLITGLFAEARDASNWKSDIAQDLAALRHVSGHGWEHHLAWLFTWTHEKLSKEERVRQVERVETEEGAEAGPEMLSALAAGYFRAGDPQRALQKLREACERFPASEFTVALGLFQASAAVVNNPEMEGELNALLARVAAAAPENKGLRELFTRLATKTGASLATIRAVADRWIAEYPENAEPHLVLATALAAVKDRSADAEAEVSQAIRLALQPHPFLSNERATGQRAFRLRAKLRADRNDLPGAIADARMAQVVADDKVGADDVNAEAVYWERLGYVRKAEDLAVEAYQHGSLESEALLKRLFTARTGGADRFTDYLIDTLRRRADAGSTVSLKPVPQFSATTLEGARVDTASLREKITVVDFWFIGCPPCRAERPKLNDIVAEFGDRVRFVGFALDKADALKAYQAATPFNYEIVPDSESIAKAFGVQAYPNHMIIDRSGSIVWLAGTDADRIARLRAMIFRVLARSGADSRPSGR
jgi:thiol-disulfide isomerase/thioredoxin